MKPIDYIIIGIVAAAVLGAIAYLIWRKKKGISGCGCGCSGCPHAGACHSQKTEPEKEAKAVGSGQVEKNIEEERTHV